MNYDEAKHTFLQTWGKVGGEWGINRTMAQVHALLLIAPKPMDTDTIMKELQISRGNANMNLRELINWNLIYKEFIPGDRKEYFLAEKDIWEIAKRVSVERRKREIEPLVKVLSSLKKVEDPDKREEVAAFKSTIKSLHKTVGKANKSIDLLVDADENWFFGTLLKIIK